MNVVSEYFEILYKYSLEYGDKTAVLMQVGSFYEVYGVDNDSEKLGNVAALSGLLNVVLTKRNKKIQDNSRSNPLMIGFPCVAVSKYMPVLLETDYTVVIVNQVKNGTNITRKVSQVISKSTYLDSINDEYLAILYIEKSTKGLHVGISSINVVTGNNVVYECHSDKGDRQLHADEIIAFMQHYKPVETIVCYTSADPPKEAISCLNSLGFTRISYKKAQKCVCKLHYQEEVLCSVFNKKTMLSVIEMLNLEKLPFAVISYVLMAEFLFAHNPLLIKKMLHPTVHIPDRYLSLNSNSIEQLDVISTKKGVSCLLNILDHCKTPAGKRLLKERLLLPLSNADKINRRINLISTFGEFVGNNKDMKDMNRALSSIGDTDKLLRRMCMGSIKPEELAKLCYSYSAMLDVSSILTKCSNLRLSVLSVNDANAVKDFINCIQDTVDIDSLCNGDIVFATGLIGEADAIKADIESKADVIKSIAHRISESVGHAKIEFLPTTGYYISIPTSKARNFHDKNMFVNKGKNVTKITSHKIDMINMQIIELKKGLKACLAKYFDIFVDSIYKKYSRTLKKASFAVSELDVVSSLYTAAKKNGYCRPKVVMCDKSFVNARGLRHPIIEVINDNMKYVPNNIDMQKKDGIVLYSINAGGKTSLLKAYGLCVILAQAGSYVPADSLEIGPFKHLATRIVSDNSILYGKSSFVSEMQDLRSILKRSNAQTLVLADEITHGTEHISGSAIFASSVITLAERGVKFVFTTHLHNAYPLIKGLPNVDVLHLSITIKTGGLIVFDYRLCNGPGSSVYGLEVCESLDMDKQFLATAFHIRNLINCDKTGQINAHMKSSRYNSKTFVRQCQVCGYCPRTNTDIPLDVHHIIPQSSSNKDGMIGSVHKNFRGNLVVLCKACHNKTHNNGINIEGYVNTLQGNLLSLYANNPTMCG